MSLIKPADQQQPPQQAEPAKLDGQPTTTEEAKKQKHRVPRPTHCFTQMRFMFCINLVFEIVTVAVSLGLVSRIPPDSDLRRVALAFSALALIFATIALIIYIIALTWLQRLVHIFTIITMVLAILAFGTRYANLNVHDDDWLLSTVWISALSVVFCLVFIFVDPAI